MNNIMKAAIFNSQVNSSMHLRAALFHSTPVLDRSRRRDSHESRRRFYARRSKRQHRKESFMRNVSSYADNLFKNWESEFDETGPSSSGGNSWFKKQHSKGPRKDWTNNQGSQHRQKRNYQFCEDDFDVEAMLRSAFGGHRFFYWSFINEEEEPHWRSSSSSYSNNYRRSSNWRYEFEEDSESEPSVKPESSKSDRIALGLSPSGPLKIEDVKNAYRTCALKWHPDRHQGSSKTVAEEKFKLCSAAYQSLCSQLAVN